MRCIRQLSIWNVGGAGGRTSAEPAVNPTHLLAHHHLLRWNWRHARLALNGQTSIRVASLVHLRTRHWLRWSWRHAGLALTGQHSIRGSRSMIRSCRLGNEAYSSAKQTKRWGSGRTHKCRTCGSAGGAPNRMVGMCVLAAARRRRSNAAASECFCSSQLKKGGVGPSPALLEKV